MRVYAHNSRCRLSTARIILWAFWYKYTSKEQDALSAVHLRCSMSLLLGDSTVVPTQDPGKHTNPGVENVPYRMQGAVWMPNSGGEGEWYTLDVRLEAAGGAKLCR